MQATYSNIKRSHKGKSVNFIKYFYEINEHRFKTIFTQYVSEDGGRFYRKRNIVKLIEINEKQKLIIPKNFKWLTLWEINKLLILNAKVNPHLRSIIAHMIAI